MADTYDLISLTEAKTAINLTVSSTNHDTELAQIITAVSQRVVDKCGPVVLTTVTNEAHDGGCTAIWLRKTPVDSVTTVTEYVGTTGTALTAESNASKPASAYLLEARGHYAKLIRRSGNGDGTFASGRLNIVVTYQAGRAANTGAVDAKFKQAAAAIVHRLWVRDAGAWARGGDPYEDENRVRFFRAVDPMVEEFLGDELKQRRAGGVMVR